MTIKISIANLQDYVQNGKQKDFAIFLYLKALYINSHSCLFEYTPENLAKILGVCRNTADALIKRFKDYGWIRIHSGRKGRFVNLIFLNTNKFLDNNNKGLLKHFKVQGDWKEINDGLYLLLLKNKQHQFDRIQKLAQDIKAPATMSVYKNARKLMKKQNYSADQLPDQNAKFQVSIKKIAEWFNSSVGKASQIITRLKKQGLIIVESCRQILGKTTNKHLVSAIMNNYNNCFYTGKYVIRVSCNCYKF